MKSLDIINKKIDHNKKQVEYMLSIGVPEEKLKNNYKDIEKLEEVKEDLNVFWIFKEYIICGYSKDMSFDTYLTSQCSPKEEKIFKDWYIKNKRLFDKELEL